MQVEAVEPCHGAQQATDQGQRIFRPHSFPDPMTQEPEQEGGDDDIESKTYGLRGCAPGIRRTLLHWPLDPIVTAPFGLSRQRIVVCEKARKLRQEGRRAPLVCLTGPFGSVYLRAAFSRATLCFRGPDRRDPTDPSRVRPDGVRRRRSQGPVGPRGPRS